MSYRSTFFADNEAPQVVYCPGNITVKTTAMDKLVKWPEPQFSDNVKVVSVTPNRQFGDLPANNYRIVYTATDAARNRKTCTFYVNVLSTDEYSFLIFPACTLKQEKHS